LVINPTVNVSKIQYQNPSINNNSHDVQFLPINFMINNIKLVTLQSGINLYHASTNNINSYKSFNTDSKISLFSNNKNLAMIDLKQCSTYPKEQGFLHKFKTNQFILNIQVIEKEDLEYINKDNTYCLNRNINGFLFSIQNNLGTYDYIIGLCNPNKYLDYLSTRRCIAPYELSNIETNIFAS
jgi:hypothetical protein